MSIVKVLRYLKKIISAKNGFTLLEILIASTVSSIILLMIYSAHRSIMFSIQDMAGVAEFYENVNLVVRRMDRDLSSMLTNKDNDKLFLIAENGVNEPYRGEIHFVTIMKSDLLITGAYNKPVYSSDIKEVSYFLKPDPNIPDLYYLMRREDKQYDEEKKKGGKESMMLENVSDIKFELAKRTINDWDSSWDTETKRSYPKAIRVTLRVKNYRAVEETFSFISYINQN